MTSERSADPKPAAPATKQGAAGAASKPPGASEAGNKAGALPAAGSPGAPASSPGAGASSSAAPASGAQAEAQPAAPRTPGVAKPILPGVRPDPANGTDLGIESEDEGSGLQRIVARDAKQDPTKDGPAPATGAGGQAAEEGDGAPPAPPPAAPTPKFKLKDVEFESEDHAAHAYKTLQGQAAAIARRGREQAARDAVLAHSLSQVGYVLQADGSVVPAGSPAAAPTANASPRASQAPTQASPAAPNAAEHDLSTDAGMQSYLDSALNWKQLPALIQAHERESGQSMGSAAAMRLVVETVIPEVVRQTREAVLKEVGTRIEPIERLHGSMRAAEAVREVFSSVADMRFPDGRPAIPEVSDPASAEEILSIWRDLGEEGLPPAFMASPKGALVAVALRDLHAKLRNGFTPPAAGMPSAGPAPLPGQDQATEVVRGIMQELEGQNGPSRDPSLASTDGRPFRATGQSDPVADLKRRIRESRGKEVIPGVRSN